MDAIDPQVLGIGGVVAALEVAVVLWKLFKLAFKVVLFIVVCLVLAGGVGGYLKYGKVALPIGKPYTKAP